MSLEQFVGRCLFLIEKTLPLLILLGALSIFCYGVFHALCASLSKPTSTKPVMRNILWLYGKNMLVFIAIGLILMVAVHLAKFSFYMQINDVVDAVITAAYAITLMGVHRGIEMSLCVGTRSYYLVFAQWAGAL